MILYILIFVLVCLYPLGLYCARRRVLTLDPLSQELVKSTQVLLKSCPTNGNQVFESSKIGHFCFSNRVIKAATYEAGCDQNGVPKSSLVDFHVEAAKGGAAMCVVAYGAVSPGGRSFPAQLVVGPKSLPALKALCAAVHEHDALVAIQLTHAGYFSDRELFEANDLNSHLQHEQMSVERENAYIVERFAVAAQLCVDAGVDCIEIHCGHGYLLSQILSPWTNRATKEERISVPGRIVDAVRARVGSKLLIMIKLNALDGFPGGQTLADSVFFAQEFVKRGVDIIGISGGNIQVNGLYMLRGKVPLLSMILKEHSWLKKLALAIFGPFLVPSLPFEELFFRDVGLVMKHYVQEANALYNKTTKVCLLGGVHSLKSMEKAISLDGFDFVQCGRALLREPDLLRKYQSGAAVNSKCIKCNQCIVDATMSQTPISCPEIPQW